MSLKNNAIINSFLITITATQLFAQVGIPIQKKVLANGMTILLVERHHAPLFSAQLAFKVGSVNEITGTTGIAHVLEHMVFKGTQTLGIKQGANAKNEAALMKREDELVAALQKEKSEALQEELQEVRGKLAAMTVPGAFETLYTAAGGQNFNAGTSFDCTLYSISLPKNRFELFCRIEADRMKGPVFREFFAEMDVIKEEQRTRTEEGFPYPSGVLLDTFLGSAFHVHPYGRPIIGCMSDLNHLQRSDLKAFFKKHYSPNNAALVLVGDLTWDEILPCIQAYFGKLERQPEAPKVHTAEPPQKGERRAVVEKNLTPMVMIGWKMPEGGHPDEAPLEVLSSILSDGVTSRLYRKAVEGRQIATRLVTSTGYPGRRFPSLFVTLGTVKGDHSTAEIEELLYEEIDRISKEAPSRAEIDKIIRNKRVETLLKLNHSNHLAEGIARDWAIYGDEKATAALLERITKVTPEDVQRVANAYLTPTNRTVTSLVNPNLKNKKSSNTATNL